jgi:hypothetical protein
MPRRTVGRSAARRRRSACRHRVSGRARAAAGVGAPTPARATRSWARSKSGRGLTRETCLERKAGRGLGRPGVGDSRVEAGHGQVTLCCAKAWPRIGLAVRGGCSWRRGKAAAGSGGHDDPALFGLMAASREPSTRGHTSLDGSCRSPFAIHLKLLPQLREDAARRVDVLDR